MGAHTNSGRGDGRDLQAILDGIRHIVQRLRESSREAERRLGLTGAQLFVLQQLGASEGLSINELAARTYTHQSSVSVVVSRLVAHGFVRRRRAAADARRRELSLTPRGRRALEAAPEAAQADLIRALQDLPANRRRALAADMRALTRELAAQPRPAMFFEGRASRR
jgi:DNA-binding MarR family transcriptional regulator